jgi:uncharacterized protein YodC (DUF2158 family)
MAFAPGDVVFLKSGGQPMTVAAVEEDSVECLWLGEEGGLFRETIPSVALSVATDAAEDADPDDDEEATEDEETDRQAADELEPT